MNPLVEKWQREQMLSFYRYQCARQVYAYYDLYFSHVADGYVIEQRQWGNTSFMFLGATLDDVRRFVAKLPPKP